MTPLVVLLLGGAAALAASGTTNPTPEKKPKPDIKIRKLPQKVVTSGPLAGLPVAGVRALLSR